MNPQVMQMDPRVLQMQQNLPQNPGVIPAQGAPGVDAGQDGAPGAPQGPKQRKGRPSKNAVNKLAVRIFVSIWVRKGQTLMSFMCVYISRLKWIISR